MEMFQKKISHVKLFFKKISHVKLMEMLKAVQGADHWWAFFLTCKKFVQISYHFTWET